MLLTSNFTILRLLFFLDSTILSLYYSETLLTSDFTILRLLFLDSVNLRLSILSLYYSETLLFLDSTSV